MPELDFRLSVKGQRKVTQSIRRSINSGFREAGEKLSRAGKNAARDRVAEKERYFTSQLIRNFESTNKKDGKGRYISVVNDSEYAATVDEGRSPGERAPPVVALIPWVKAKMGGNITSTGGPSSDSGGGGITQTEPRNKNSDEWFSRGSGVINPTRWYVGQQVKWLNDDDEIVDGNIIERNNDGFVVRFLSGESTLVEWDSDRLRAGERWDVKSGANRRQSVLDSWNNISDDPHDVFSQEYAELSDSDKELLDNEFSTLLDRAKSDRMYKYAADTIFQRGELVDNNALGHIKPTTFKQVGKADHALGLDMSKDSVQSTFAHEVHHGTIKGMNLRRSPHTNHSADWSSGFQEWDIDPDTGKSRDTDLHTDPKLFALHNESSYNVRTMTEDEGNNNPPGWEKTVDEVPDYIHDELIFETQEAEDPDPTEYLNPDDTNIQESDKMWIQDTDSLYEDEIVFVDSEPVLMDSGEYRYNILRGGEESSLFVDEDGNLIDEGPLVFWHRNANQVNLDTNNAQQYLMTDIDENPEQAYHEAINRAWYTQVFAKSYEVNQLGHAGDRVENSTIDNLRYSSINADETAAVFHQLMNMQNDQNSSGVYVGDAVDVVRAHPYLAATWLNFFSPSDDVANALRNAGGEL